MLCQMKMTQEPRSTFELSVVAFSSFEKEIGHNLDVSNKRHSSSIKLNIKMSLKESKLLPKNREKNLDEYKISIRKG